ncbi:unnamed protein product [Allacma fusca]|uniref:Uncharacterized protein n=1 Tax=Allacma fusca TaxID=39272 RepID=A0A8J2LKX7_9HEXA|nr:unnamed protein product [Allacma fusca]
MCSRGTNRTDSSDNFFPSAIYTAAVLFYVTIAQTDKCRFNVPVTSNVLKCGYQVYPSDWRSIDAINNCGSGGNGTEINDQDIFCIFEELTYTINDRLIVGSLFEANRINFPLHYKALYAGAIQCAKQYLQESNWKEFKHVECRVKAFKDV